uniref:Putative secreted protein n=2 Tax=Nyssorhynchus TaxID=44543 RepID=A0A2M4B394_9DIPT
MTLAFALSITSLMPSSTPGVFRLMSCPVALTMAVDSRSFFGVFGPPTAGTMLRRIETSFLAKFDSSVPDMSSPRFSIVLRRLSDLRSRTIDCLCRGIIGRPLFIDSLRESFSRKRFSRICFAISRISCSVSSRLSSGGS